MGKLIPVITGPTASGKSDAAFLLAQSLDSEIISSDSRQIYKYLNIGTAKPDRQTLDEVKHHFIDSHEPDEVFSAGKFEQEGREILKQILAGGKTPIVCGGTGLYIQALRDGIIKIEADEDYRGYIKKYYEENGSEALHEELRRVDPLSAEKIPASTYKRVARALEVFHLTGVSIITQMENQKKNDDLKFVIYCLLPEREYLYGRINNRAETMVQSGLVEETENLLKRYPAGINALNTVGYKETISFINKEIQKDEMLRLIQRNTRHFAKRQYTWFRNMEDINFIQTSAGFTTEHIAQIIEDDFNERIKYET